MRCSRRLKNTNRLVAMAYLVAILKELRKDVLSRADSMQPTGQRESTANSFPSITPHTVPASECEERPKPVQAKLPGATISRSNGSLYPEVGKRHGIRYI